MASRTPPLPGPHRDLPALHTGAPIEQARLAVVLVHGRGATASHMLELAADLATPDVAFLAPHEVTVGQFRQFVEATGYKTEAEKDFSALSKG